MYAIGVRLTQWLMTIDRGIPSLLTVAFDELPGGVTLALVHKPHTSGSKVPNGEKTMVMVPEPPEKTRYKISRSRIEAMLG